MQNARIRAQIGLTTALLALALGAAPAAAEPVGFVAGVEGEVEIQPGGQTSWTAASVDGEVEIGDSVRTGFDSALKIVLVDDTTLSLGEDTELVIDSFVVGAAAVREVSVLRHLRGQIRTRVGEAFGGTTRVEIHTPTTVMGVKGTELSSRIDTTGGETTTLGCNWEGGVFMYLHGDATRMDVPLNHCRRAWSDRIGPPINVPADYVPVKPPSSPFGAKGLQALFGSGDAGLLDDWIASNAPVSGPFDPAPTFSTPPELEPVFDNDPAVVAPPAPPAFTPPPFPTIGGGEGSSTTGN